MCRAMEASSGKGSAARVSIIFHTHPYTELCCLFDISSSTKQFVINAKGDETETETETKDLKKMREATKSYLDV